LVVKRLMRPGVVVELKVGRQSSLSILQILVGTQEHVLVLYGAPQPFSKDVVQVPASAIHTHLDTCLFQEARVCQARKMTALI